MEDLVQTLTRGNVTEVKIVLASVAIEQREARIEAAEERREQLEEIAEERRED